MGNEASGAILHAVYRRIASSFVVAACAVRKVSMDLFRSRLAFLCSPALAIGLVDRITLGVAASMGAFILWHR